jgi:hypothetical protein
MWPFTRKQSVEELVRDLMYTAPAVEHLTWAVDAFENANPMVGALGNAFGMISVGGQNPALHAKLAELNRRKARLARAERKQQKRRTQAAGRLAALAERDPSEKVRNAAREALDHAPKTKKRRALCL